MKFKKTLLATLVATTLLSTAASALESANGFTYPDVTHTEQDTITHGVLFFYSDDMLSFFDNDPEKLLAYAQRNIDLNNDIFKRQNIILRREIAGVVKLPDSLGKDEANLEEAEAKFASFIESNKASIDKNYKASYFVLLNRKYDSNELGRAKLGGSTSVITPRSIDETSVTLTHELGHNDGLHHDINEIPIITSAVGIECEGKPSIMSAVLSNANEFFFSSRKVFATNGTQCGSDQSDAANAYTKVAPVYLKYKTVPFLNNQPVKDKSGEVGITIASSVIYEGEDINIEVVWSGAAIGDTVQLVTKADTALANIDYTPELFTITYNGTDSTTVTVKTIDDDKFENDKTMSLVLVNNNGINIDDNLATSIITIQSDDLAPVTPPVTPIPPPANNGDEDSGGTTGSGLLSLMLVALFPRTKWFSKA